MSDFKYFNIENGIYDDYILLTSTEDAYYSYDDIYKFLIKSKGISFNIILDLFLRNGYTFNRFVLLSFNGEKIISKIINPREISQTIKDCTKNYLKQNFNLLNESALTKSTISFIINS